MIKSAEFVKSSGKYSQCPTDKKLEIAFIGRSNVGKSSLINAITNRTKLAKISSTPGKTQHINHFIINGTWYLVDLPGYGYARVSKNLKKSFEGMIENYLINRETLTCVFVLIDSRHSLQKVDEEFINWLGENSIPFALIYTKADKLKKGEKIANIKRIENKLLETWEELPPSFLTSSAKKEGLEPLLSFIEEACILS